MANTKKKGAKKKTEIPNPFEGRNADVVWQEWLQKSKPISREEIIKRLGNNPNQKESTEN